MERIAGTPCRCAYEMAFPAPENSWEEQAHEVILETRFGRVKMRTDPDMADGVFAIFAEEPDR